MARRGLPGKNDARIGAPLQSALLFGWGIGINDADNGVFLPRDRVGLPGYPSAPRHNRHHRVAYHLAVYDELQHAETTDEGRSTLRFLKTKILFRCAGALT